jgi:hypothetical protein
MNRELEYLFPIFRSPDIETAPAGGASPAMAVPAESSPTGEPIAVTPRQPPKQGEIVQPASVEDKPKRIRQPGVKVSKVDVMKELGLKESPSETMAKESAKMRAARGERERDGDGKFLPSKPPEETAHAKLGEPKPEAAKPAAPVEQPKAPVTVPKIRIGDMEKTEAEWSEHLKTIEEAKKMPVEQPTPEDKKDPTPEEAKAAHEKVRADWRSRTKINLMDKFNVEPAKIDNFLASGDPKLLADIISDMVTDGIEDTWLAMGKQINPVIDELQRTLKPVASTMEEQRLEHAYTQFVDQHADIKAHPEARAAIIEITAELTDEFAAIKEIIRTQPHSRIVPNLQARMHELETKWFDIVAQMTREKLGITSAAPSIAAVTRPAPTAPPPKPRPVAPGGNIGGSGVPRKTSAQADQVAQLRAHEGI